MNTETLDNMIAVLQAHKEGKQIQMRGQHLKEWRDAKVLNYNWTLYDYRVKPEAREFWVNVYPNQAPARQFSGKTIHVKGVIE